MKKLRKSLCERFCPHYKPRKDEELACLGFIVIERLIQKGLKIPVEESGHALDAATEEQLAGTLCSACPFFPEDCDFAQNKGGAQPCGGFVLLGILLEKNVIDIDIIREIR
ncbi:MAG: hypothetical protein AB1442_01650 [Nitrospirota bacterium]